jgi:hypothetical protein
MSCWSVLSASIDVVMISTHGTVSCVRQEHTLARAIHAIQAALWPGGTWFMYRPEYPRLKVLVPHRLGGLSAGALVAPQCCNASC